MPQFRFHVRDGVRIADRYNDDLPDLRSARLAAVRLTEELLLEHCDASWIDEDWKIVVTDERNIAVFVLQISAIFDYSRMAVPMAATSSVTK